MTVVPLSVDTHLAGLEAAAERLARWAETAGPDAPVPTCPGWTVADLVLHQGRVHRWALAALRGADLSTTTIDGIGDADPEAVAWLRAGAAELLDVLRSVPDDHEAATFLREAPAPRLFWARRQHLETAVHALDALAAVEGRVPTTGDVWWDADVALDAVDELLVGFWPRRRRGSPLSDDAYTALVAPDEGGRWLLTVGPDPVVTRRVADGEDVSADRILSGPALDVHMALWHRGGAPTDPTGLVDDWAAAVVV